MVRIPHILVGLQPTTDLFHVLACAHGRCPVTGSTGVGRRPTHPSPPQGLGFFGAKRKKILVYYTGNFHIWNRLGEHTWCHALLCTAWGLVQVSKGHLNMTSRCCHRIATFHGLRLGSSARREIEPDHEMKSFLVLSIFLFFWRTFFFGPIGDFFSYFLHFSPDHRKVYLKWVFWSFVQIWRGCGGGQRGVYEKCFLGKCHVIKIFSNPTFRWALDFFPHEY